MNTRNQRNHRQDSNFSGRNHDESPNQWTAYGRSDSERSDRGSYRADQTDWTGSDYDRSEGRESRGGRSFDGPRDYDTSRDVRTRDNSYRGSSEYRENQDRYGSSMRGDERQHQMNPYPHSYSEYDSRRDMESRRFGAHEGNGYVNDRSHDEYSDSRELYRPSFDDSSRASSPFSGGGYSSQNPSQQWGSSMNGSMNRSMNSGEDRSQQSSYSGRGPRGFKRSDERIKEEVCEMLTRDHSIDAEDIDVEVKDGEVTLTGSVSERRMKHLAEDVVERALGVKDVTNNIRVKREGSSNKSSDIESASLTGDRTITDRKSAAGSSSSTGKSNH
jgi:osmotically-inducible protein OsmY